ncbi:dienelactone hydrolase family protein, partial [Klebsiella pneumoniae]
GGPDYGVVIQDGAKHGFTNPDADAHKGHGLDIGYDRQADRRSWADLQAFLKDIFGEGWTLRRRIKKRESPEGLPS